MISRMERFRYSGERFLLIQMPKRRRDRHDIVIDILKRTRSEKTKTELMRDVSISFTQAKEFVEMLQKNGLLESTENHRLVITDKGLKFLENCKNCFLFTWDRPS